MNDPNSAMNQSEFNECTAQKEETKKWAISEFMSASSSKRV